MKRASWWDTHPDRIPSDYGEPERKSPPISEEERQKRNDEFEAMIQERIKWDEEHPPEIGWGGIEITNEIPW